MAQTPDHLVFSSLPPYHEDSVPTADGAAHAYFDFAKSQIVVVLADSLPNGTLQTLRYDLPNGVNPTVSWAVTTLPSGGYSYNYSISDDPRSARRSSSVSILTPDFDTTLARGDGSPWQFSMENTRVPDRSSTVGMAAMRRVTWTDTSTSNAKIVALTLAVTSQFAPGFCDLAIEGLVSTPLTAQVIASLPSSVVAAVQQATSPGIGIITRIATCPLFRSDTPKIVVASNYYAGIQHLMRNGSLDAGSSYVQQLSNYLQGFLSAGGVGMLAAPTFEPRSVLEQQIRDAISIALK
jgi:hypothetical protein